MHLHVHVHVQRIHSTRSYTHQVILLMAKDPAVSWIGRDCFMFAEMPLTKSAAEQQESVPWGIDRIDSKGEPASQSQHFSDLVGICPDVRAACLMRASRVRRLRARQAGLRETTETGRAVTTTGT